MATIAIQVDDTTATRYANLSQIKRDQVDATLRKVADQALSQPVRDLMRLMDDIGAIAEKNGLTEEILNEILSEPRT